MGCDPNTQGGRKIGEDIFADYFMSNEGSIPWQDRIIWERRVTCTTQIIYIFEGH